jgi:hypothetical protein
LAGENIAARRWTAAYQARIRASRVEGTRLLAEALAAQSARPSVFVCASAVGFYGDRGDELLTEGSRAGEGFLAEVCREWEAASSAARTAGIRVVHLRFGMILSRRGGALARLVPIFRWGLGGRLGAGRQWCSWLTLADAVGIISHVLVPDGPDGPVNAVAPNAVRNSEFTRILARVLRRPAVCPVPAFALRLALGQMAEALLLASTRVEPRHLLETGYRFNDPELEPALRRELTEHH